MQQRTKRIILISVLVLVLIVLVLVYFFLRPPAATPGTDSTPLEVSTTVDDGSVPVSDVVVPAGQPSAVEVVTTPGTADQRLVAKQTARTFVERFLTYSNQNDNEHLDSVQDMMTPVMAGWANKQVQEQSLREYAGVTTVVVSTNLTEFATSTAMVGVAVQQVIESADASTTEQRSGRVELVFEDDEWLVEGFYWDKK